MRMKASVYKQYGDAAIMNIVLDSLPKVSAYILRESFGLNIKDNFFYQI